MAFYPELKFIPPILDFEASSLSDCSYPISVGLVIGGETFYRLIKPKEEWVDWSLPSQAIHGLRRSDLIEHGYGSDRVYRELLNILLGVRVVYSDSPYWETNWLTKLGKFEFEIRDVTELIPPHNKKNLKTVMDQKFQDLNLTPHRADHDALAMSMAIKQLLT